MEVAKFVKIFVSNKCCHGREELEELSISLDAKVKLTQN